MINKDCLKDFLDTHTQKEASDFFKISLRTLERLIGQYSFERQGANKLNLNKAKEIRRLYKDGNTQKEIAKSYNVSQGTIQKIVNNISYREPAAVTFGGESITKVNYGNIQKRWNGIEIKRT